MKYKYLLKDRPERIPFKSAYFWFSMDNTEHAGWGVYYNITTTLGKLYALSLMRSLKPGRSGAVAYRYSDLLG